MNYNVTIHMKLPGQNFCRVLVMIIKKRILEFFVHFYFATVWNERFHWVGTNKIVVGSDDDDDDDDDLEVAHPHHCTIRCSQKWIFIILF